MASQLAVVLAPLHHQLTITQHLPVPKASPYLHQTKQLGPISLDLLTPALMPHPLPPVSMALGIASEIAVATQDRAVQAVLPTSAPLLQPLQLPQMLSTTPL